MQYAGVCWHDPNEKNAKQVVVNSNDADQYLLNEIPHKEMQLPLQDTLQKILERVQLSYVMTICKFMCGTLITVIM